MSDDCSIFHRLLEEHPVLVADGAMGTTLFSLGLEPGGCPEVVNLTESALVEEVHRSFIEAGSDLILTNTFGGNRRRLALHDLEGEVEALNHAAVEIARRAVADRPVAVAGSIGPTGDLLAPLGPLSREEAADVFRQQGTALAEAGADVLWVETLSSFEELDAAMEGVSGLGLPYAATLSFDTNGHTMMGISPEALADWWSDHPHQPLALGANCGVGPPDAVAVVHAVTAVNEDVVAIAKPNCGMPLYQTDLLVYPVGPEGMADFVELSVGSGARIVGACCGSTPEHIAAIRAAVDEFEGRGRPSRAEIRERLGGSVPRNRERSRRSGARSR